MINYPLDPTEYPDTWLAKNAWISMYPDTISLISENTKRNKTIAGL